MKTVGHITRAIARAHAKHKRSGFAGPTPNWIVFVRRHFERFARSQGKTAKVSGPFGLCCRFTVEIGRQYRVFEIDNCRGWHFGRRTNEPDTTFKPGSIGALNGMNFKYEEIPNTTPLAALFKKGAR